MMNMRSIQIRVAGDSVAAQKALRDLGVEAQRAGFKVTESTGKAGEAMTRMQRRAQEMGEVATGSFTKAAGGIGKFVGAAGLGGLAVAIGKAGLGFQDFQQKSQLAFSTMLGDAGKAKTFLADILEFARDTPFSFKDLTSSAQNLVSFGVAAQRVIPIMRTLTDAAIGAGKGIQEIDGMATVVGQISAKGRLQTEEILQLAERGVPAMAVLANKAGKTVMDFQKDVSAGLVDANQAIDWLVEGLAKGTTGVNGFTPAYEGLAKSLKESGGIAATVDSARSAFTQASSALVEQLVPSLLSLVNAGVEGLKVARWLAERFNALPKPLRDTALALGALAVANRALNLDLGTRSQAALTGFVRSLDRSHTAMHSAGRQASTMRAGLDTLRTGAASTGKALLGAFGGPVGIAVAGVTMALSAYSATAAEAKARTDELRATLDETGNTTAETASLIAEKMAEIREYSTWDRLWEGMGSGSKLAENGTNIVDDARKVGIATELILNASMKDLEAMQLVEAALNNGMLERGSGNGAAYIRIREFIESNTGALDDAIKVAKDKAAIDEASKNAVDGVGDAYERTTRKALDFTSTTDPVVKAIQEQANAAANAFAGATGVDTFKLNLSTKDDVKKAREAVADATKNVRREEEQLAEVRNSKDVKASSIASAEEAVADARKRAEEAAKDLADVEARRDPVAQYRKQLKSQQKAAESFTSDMLKLAEQGLNGTTLQELYVKGPEGSADVRKALLKDKSLIGETNDFQTTMDGIAGEIETLARVNAARLNTAGGVTAEEFNLGLRVAMEGGAETSLSSLANKLGEDPSKIREVGRLLGIEFVAGFADAGVPWAPGVQPSDPKKFPFLGGFANGGIYPGYTPGRDIGFIGVSGGEAIMRPEFTRAVGPDWVHRMNALARSVGAAGVQREMGRYLGGFANGGVPVPHHVAPQVIRLTESQTVGYPMTVENLTVQSNNVADLERQMRAQRRRAFTGGRP